MFKNLLLFIMLIFCNVLTYSSDNGSTSCTDDEKVIIGLHAAVQLNSKIKNVIDQAVRAKNFREGKILEPYNDWFAGEGYDVASNERKPMSKNEVLNETQGSFWKWCCWSFICCGQDSSSQDS